MYVPGVDGTGHSKRNTVMVPVLPVVDGVGLI